jgi:hypothetical protein
VAVVDAEGSVFAAVEPFEEEGEGGGVVGGEGECVLGGRGPEEVAEVGDFGAEEGFVDAEDLLVGVRADGDVN